MIFKIMYIIGNKFDLRINRIVHENEAKDLANKYDAKYMEVRAKNGLNIDRLFEYIIQDLLRKEENRSNESSGNAKNNSIYRNVMSIRSNDSIRNTNRFFTENESRQNFETSNNYFLKTNNYINQNNVYINNINNYQKNQNTEQFNQSYYYYQNDNKSKKCLIF